MVFFSGCCMRWHWKKMRRKLMKTLTNRKKCQYFMKWRWRKQRCQNLSSSENVELVVWLRFLKFVFIFIYIYNNIPSRVLEPHSYRITIWLCPFGRGYTLFFDLRTIGVWCIFIFLLRIIQIVFSFIPPGAISVSFFIVSHSSSCWHIHIQKHMELGIFSNDIWTQWAELGDPLDEIMN